MRISESLLFKGSICLTEFPFTSLKQTKIRPVVILHYDKQYDDVIVVAISSTIFRKNNRNIVSILSTDKDFTATGLRKSSLIICNCIVTLNKERLFHSLGILSKSYLDILDQKLIEMMQIDLSQLAVENNQSLFHIKRSNYIPYSRQFISDKDVHAVVKTLRSNYLTTGPKIPEFEKAITKYTGAKYGVAVSSGTAALHCAMHALGIKQGDEVIVPPITFAATANAVCYMGAVPIFADVEPGTLLINPNAVESLITDKTRAIIGVDYAGQPCDWDAIKAIANKYDLKTVADSCHAIGAEYKDRKVGTLADMTVFSFHPVKHITTGEGGMIVTDNPEYAEKMRIFRNHGITSDVSEREKSGAWYYEMKELGFNYRISDIQCALGISQLKKLDNWLIYRRSIAPRYFKHFTEHLSNISPLELKEDVKHAWHIFVVKINTDYVSRDDIFKKLRNMGIGVNVHYIPVHLHPWYREKFGYDYGLCPIAEEAYKRLLTLPLYHGMTDDDFESVLSALRKVML